jgi:hypothetical protein
MPENQTMEKDASVDAFLSTVGNPRRREDALTLVRLMQQVTGKPPKMWGPSIIGFGRYRYRYDTGREGDMFRVGFSPRKANLVLYLSSKGAGFDELLGRLGKVRTGASCLYVNKLADVDLDVLKAMIVQSWESAREAYGEPE